MPRDGESVRVTEMMVSFVCFVSLYSQCADYWINSDP